MQVAVPISVLGRSQASSLQCGCHKVDFRIIASHCEFLQDVGHASLFGPKAGWGSICIEKRARAQAARNVHF